MNTGKCPHCGKRIDKAKVEMISPDTNATQLYGPLPIAYAFVCPHPACAVILGIVPAPVAQ
jgi:hypothetical protein